MSRYSIKDLSALSGIKAHTLRIWEQRYSLLKPQRTDTNIRYYSDEELKYLLRIAHLNKHGMKISRLASLSEEKVKELFTSYQQADSEKDQIITQFSIYMLDLNEEAFEKLFSSCIKLYSIETCFIEIIYPFLEKVGVLWMNGSINPAQEHFMSNIIRLKLISAINDLPTTYNASPEKRHILFLPENEYHEIGLLLSWYMLKSRNREVIYLGANVPIEDIESVSKIKPAKNLHLVLTNTHTRKNYEAYLTELIEKHKDGRIYICGLAITKYLRLLSSAMNVTVLHNPEELQKILDKGK